MAVPVPQVHVKLASLDLDWLIILTLIGIILTAVGVWYAYKQYKLAGGK